MKKGYKLNKHFVNTLRPHGKVSQSSTSAQYPNIYKSFVGLPLGVALSSIFNKRMTTIIIEGLLLRRNFCNIAILMAIISTIP